MHRNIARVFAAMAASVAAGALGVTGPGAPGAAAQPAGPAGVAIGVASRTPAPGTQLWVARYNGPVSRYDDAVAVAAGPAGRRVFVTGRSTGTGAGDDYFTIAYDAATGAQLWASRYPGPVEGTAAPAALAMSPSGATVFVTGVSISGDGVGSYLTIAYDAVTGVQRWVSRYSSGSQGSGQGSLASSMAVSPTGTLVFVTGYSDGPHGLGYATVAYNAATGAQIWIRRYSGPGSGDDLASSVSVSPTGARVFVTGFSARADGSGNDFATVAYNAATGVQLWVTRYGTPASDNAAIAVTVSPSGGRIFVTGSSLQAGQYDYVTVGYNARTGTQVWLSRYNGTGNGDDIPAAMAISPTGSKVFVTGWSAGTVPGEADYATIAYDTATGTRLWVMRHDGRPRSVAVSPSGGTVFVTGEVYGSGNLVRNYGTIAYRAATGKRLWTARYDGPAQQDDSATAVAVSPTGGTVFVTGYSQGIGTQSDYATIAYQG
jgi:putative pyrroloquinoline-quinone binding quinoprotein